MSKKESVTEMTVRLAKKTPSVPVKELTFNKIEAIEALSEMTKKASGDYVTIHKKVLEKIVEALIAG